MTRVSMQFQLDHFRNVVPSSWFYILYNEYTIRKKIQKDFNPPFFSFVYSLSEALCGDEQKKPIGMSYACTKRVSFNIVPVSTPNPGTHYHILAPLATSAIVLVFLIHKLQ